MLTALGCSAQVSANPDNQKIVIKYSTIIYGEPWIGDSQYLLPSSDSYLVIANFTIENQGYAEFKIDKAYFSAVVDGTTYRYDPDRCVNDLLADAPIANGVVVTGSLPFQLPILTMDPDITWKYEGPYKYNIEWVNLDPPPAETTTIETTEP